MTVLRVLPSIRLSNDTAATNSPATQRVSIEDWAAEHGHHIVAWAEDLDVSGAVPIRERPGIGPWLAGGRLGEWDAICGHELDRLFRDMRDFVTFARDMKREHGKIIIDVSDGTDTSTQRGMQILEDRALAAERERTRMAERRTRTAQRIRADQRWNGGLLPFGYAAERAAKGWRLVPDKVYGPVLSGMAADLIGGKSLNAIAAGLNARKIPTATDITRLRYGRPARGVGWKPQSVRAVLAGRAVTGVTTYHGEVVRSSDGYPLLRAEPVVREADYLAMQQILVRPAGRRAGARQSRVLLHVAMCGLCGADLYGKANARNRYYQCPNSTPARGVKERCSAPLVRADVLESTVEQALLDSAGDVLMYEKIVTPANDVGAELARADEAIGALASQVTSGALTAGQFAQVAAGLITQRDHLAAVAAPERVTWRPAGKTFREHWADLHDRGTWLRGAGIRVFVQDGGNAEPRTWTDLRASLEAVGVRVEEPDGSTAVEPADDYIVVRELPGGRVVSVMLGELGELRRLAGDMAA
jgi:site-specific DNA recombinase